MALSAGYVDIYDPEKERSKVIVVMTQDFTISCYSSELKLLWEKGIAHKAHHMEYISEHFEVAEASILVSSLNLQSDILGGTVIIGASMKQIEQPNHSHIKSEGGLDESEDGNKEHPEINERSELEHFSVYALSGLTGHIIWKHDGSEVKHEQYTRSLPQHAYSLDTFDLSHMAPSHFGSSGNNDWSLFKASLIAELPHDWHKREDTKMRFAHFVRRHLGASSRGGSSGGDVSSHGKKTSSTVEVDSSGKQKRSVGKLISGEGGRFLGIESPPLSISASLPHDASEHTDHPNVLVMHTQQGLEAISLRAGLPVTSFALNKGQTYADVDGDGVIDSVLVLESEQDVELHRAAFGADDDLQSCMVMVLSGLPPKAQLFNGTVCTHRRSLSDPMMKPQANKASAVSAASPVILREVDSDTLSESKQRLVAISINSGISTCYDGNGEYRWQLKGGPTWALDFAWPSLLHYDVDAARVAEFGSHDNVYAHLLVMGDNEVSLMDREGYVMTYALLPKSPIAAPVLGDFDNDGVTDVIVITDDAILGYRLEVTPSSQAMLIAVLCLSSLAVVVFLANLQSEVLETRHGKKVVYSMLRSTDDHHID